MAEEDSMARDPRLVECDGCGTTLLADALMPVHDPYRDITWRLCGFTCADVFLSRALARMFLMGDRHSSPRPPDVYLRRPTGDRCDPER